MAKDRISRVKPYSVWPFMRDHARGTTPYAEEQLAKCRTYESPSKAHIKRLKRPRVEVRIVRKPQPKQPDAMRLDANMLYRFAMQSRSIVKKDQFRHG